jgi:hypothetical protein
MRRTDAILLLVAAAAWTGCRSVWLPFSAPLPTEHEVPGEQLVFECDFDLPRDHRLVRELKAERDDISAALGIPPSEEQIHVHLYRDAEKYSQILARKFPSVPSRRAFFVETDTRLEVYAHWSDRVAEDLRHEVAHGYLHASVPALPLWLDEGLAEYFEVPRGHGGLNRPHLELLADLMEHNGWRPNLVELERLKSAAEMDQTDYAEAWAWVYFLLESDPERHELLTAYLAELRENGSAEPLSVRLSSRYVEPQRTIAEYLAAVRADVVAR